MSTVETASIAANLLAAWTKANVESDLEGLVDLYTADALLFGSKAQLFSGHSGVREYFGAIPEGCVRAIHFTELMTSRPAENLVQLAAFVDFHLDIDGDRELLEWRILLTLVAESDRWRIAGHHAAARAPNVKLSATG